MAKKDSLNKSKPKTPTDRPTKYAMSVVSGDIPAGPIVRSACHRHLDDLKNAGDRGFYYDESEASEAIAFFEECLCLNGGQFEGKPFLLLGWEDFVIGSLFGWKRKSDKTRRFRVAYIETPKGPLSLDTPIATPSGWTTMGDISVGDYVFNSQGKPTIVTGVSPVFYDRDCFEVGFSDGAKIIADAEHMWKVNPLRTGRRPGPHNNEKITDIKRSTKHISNTYKMPVSTSKHPQAKWNYRVDVAPPLDLPDIKLPINPYTLGAWLGDGDSDAARITSEDEEIIENIKADGFFVGKKYFKPNGKAFRQPIGIGNPDKCNRGHQKVKGKHCLICERMTDHARRHGLPLPPTPPSSLQVSLRREGLLCNKRIPVEYFRAGTVQRLSLLQGIMDTDGSTAKNGKCEITLCNQLLINDVLKLLHTLGYKCTIRESAAKLNGKEVGLRWRIGFQAYVSQPPFRLKRKLLNLSKEPKTRSLCRGRMIVSCDPVPSVPVRCITVESDDHMFLAGENLIPTCNSGKSPVCAGIGIKGLVADNEPRAEIYAAATFREQAMVLFRDAVAFYDQSPELQKRLIASGTGASRWNLAYLDTASFFRVISSEKKGQSGPRPHMALLDEIHEHRDGTVIEMLRAGFKFRRQPMSVMITNSGYDKTSVCWEYHEMGEKIATGAIPNDEFFAYICSLDEADLKDDKYLTDESLWAKVNPSLDAGIPGYDYIRSQVTEAQGMPSKMATVKRLCFCIWTEALNPWIGADIWLDCKDTDFDESLLAGRKCWGGLDLSRVNDLTSLVLSFEPTGDDPFWRLKSYFWVPGEGLKYKCDQDHVPYDVWRDNGFIDAPPVKTIKKSYVVRQIQQVDLDYDLQGIAYDRAMVNDLFQAAEDAGVVLIEGKWDKEKKRWDFGGQEGIKIMPFGQEPRSMHPAIEKFEERLKNQEMKHNGNPVMTWCASNAVVKEIDNYRRLSKSLSTGRIDGVTAGVMAVGVSDVTSYEKRSVYEGKSIEEIREMMI